MHLTLPALRRVLGRTWRQPFDDNLGELYIRVLLDDALGREAAELAAAGWGGDLWVLLVAPSEADALVWLTTWDNEADAAEFVAAAAIWLAR